jgi:hypothetical protein
MCFQALPVAESFFEPFRHHTLVKEKKDFCLQSPYETLLWNCKRNINKSYLIAIINGSSWECVKILWSIQLCLFKILFWSHARETSPLTGPFVSYKWVPCACSWNCTSFFILYSQLCPNIFAWYLIQHWSSLRFYCIGGFWDRTQDCCNDLSVLSTAQTWPRGLTDTHFMLPSTVVQVRPMGLADDTFNSISYCNKVNNAKHTHCSLIPSTASVTAS